MEKAFLNISSLFLRLNHLCVEPARFRKDLYAHEAYPSLKALTDVLSDWEIEYRALKIGWEQLCEYGTPVLLHYRDSMPRFVVATSVTTDGIVFYKDEGEKFKASRQDFEKRWDGTALYVVEPEKREWKCFCKVLFTQYRGWLLLLVSLLLLIPLLSFSRITDIGRDRGIGSRTIKHTSCRCIASRQQAYAQANEIVTQATAQAQEIIDNATRDANEIRIGAIQYTDDLLANAESIIGHTLDSYTTKYDGLINSLQECYDTVRSNRAELDIPEEDSDSYGQDGTI